ncbi:class I adenylate-forming enzyme family protein [Paenibacillus sp. FSL R5-0341]|uniref:class I adenylate-forming enzyme family protein n=1 Tax=Paenibacillus sp. FSL R5-0341 TaxID=2921636 RepID=UPI0030D2C46A
MEDCTVPTTIHESILLVAEMYRDKKAIITLNESVTYLELVNRASDLANRFTRPLRVGICIKDPIQFAIVYLGSLIGGGQILLLSASSSQSEVITMLEQADCDVLFTDRTDFTNFIGKVFVYSIEQANFDLLQSEQQLTTNDNTAVMVPTSGSISRPKIVKLSHKALIWNAMAHNEHLDMRSNDIALVILPLTSSFAHTTQFLAQLLIGGTCVIHNGVLFPRDIYQTIRNYQITSMGCVSTHLKLFVLNPPSPEDVKTLKLMVCAGAPTDIETISQAREMFKHADIVRAYGLTEAGPRVSCGLKNKVVSNDSSGVPLKGVQIKVMGEENEGTECLLFEPGEIWVNSPSLYNGYYEKGNKDYAQKPKEEWLKTGDIGYIDAENQLFILGRSKNIIIVGGMNVYPEEVEEILCRFPDISDAYVYGREDSLTGEQVVAEIVVRSGEVKLSDIRKFCSDYLSKYKIPKSVNVVDSIKRTETGKVQRGSRVNSNS